MNDITSYQSLLTTASRSDYLLWPCTTIVLLLLHYLLLFLIYGYNQQRKGNTKLPPMVPYAFPLIGNVFAYLWDPWSFISAATLHADKQTVSGIKLLGWDLYLLQGKENIQAAWKSSALSTPTFVISYALGTIFGMPDKAVDMYEKDNTGISPRPKHGSSVEPRNRIDYKTHQLLGKLLTGDGLAPLFDRFRANLNAMIQGPNFGEDWTAMPDLFQLLQQRLTPCIIEALCGTTLLKENPDFVNNFWQFNESLATLSKRIPRILAPRAYNRRDRLINAIKKWHVAARKAFKHEDEDSGFEQHWGSIYIRQRQAMFQSVDNFDDHDAMASADLGMIWATNTNAVTATFWTIFEIFRDQSLLNRVRDEVSSCLVDSTDGQTLDIHKLLKVPLLESIYHEVLRLRTHVYITRGSNSTAATVKEWIFPRGKVVLIPTTPSHLDSDAWYKGQDEDHPADTFWADRFLVPTEKGVKFSMEKSKGLWFPYGGGERICPGRHFAKREIIFAAAQFAHSFDMQIKSTSENPSVHRGDYGLRILGPAESIPIEIRRR